MVGLGVRGGHCRRTTPGMEVITLSPPMVGMVEGREVVVVIAGQWAGGWPSGCQMTLHTMKITVRVSL